MRAVDPAVPRPDTKRLFAVHCLSMAPNPRATPGEFGEALKGLRAASGTALESIAERTKISGRALAALETGDFGKLPDRVFARMFLRQYLDLVGAPSSEWLPAFEAAWQRYEDESHPNLAIPSLPMRGTRFSPWVIGLLLVTAGVLAVVLVVEKPRRRAAPAHTIAPPQVATGTVGELPTRVPTPVVSAASSAPPPWALVVRTDASPCWVEVRVAGQQPSSRLLPSRATWTVDAGGKDVDLVLGDAGAATVEYLGEVRRPAGPSGTVARLHLDGSRQAGTGP
jgi:transcriptional regulator with XRE-family HTH domain